MPAKEDTVLAADERQRVKTNKEALTAWEQILTTPCSGAASACREGKP
jgi:hypothetical protein